MQLSSAAPVKPAVKIKRRDANIVTVAERIGCGYLFFMAAADLSLRFKGNILLNYITVTGLFNGHFPTRLSVVPVEFGYEHGNPW